MPRKNQSSFVPLVWEEETPDNLLARISETGIVGMGGAGFSTAKKIECARKFPPNVLIANGVETDPGVNADKVLLEQHLREVLTGMRIVAKILTTQQCFIAVSDKDIELSVQQCLKHTETVRYLKATFQNGAERELVEILTGHVVNDNAFPAFEGIVVLNVHTLFSIAQAVQGIQLTKRLITVDNTTRWVAIGTPIDELVGPDQQVRVGSYATGHRPQQNEVLTAKVNAISIDKSVHAQPCIKCGWCDASCPRDLPVESLYWAAQSKEPSFNAQTALDRCNDCGACVVACPSSIHLLDHLRELRQRNINESERISRAAGVKKRVEAREQRLRAQTIESNTTRSQRMRQPHKWH